MSTQDHDRRASESEAGQAAEEPQHPAEAGQRSTPWGAAQERASREARELRQRLQGFAAELSETAHRKGAALRETVERGATAQD